MIDYILSNNYYHGLFIEMKNAKKIIESKLIGRPKPKGI